MNADTTQIAADTARERLNAISGRIIGSAQKVSSTLGCGFLEKVYENSLRIELETRRLRVDQQPQIQVFYENRIVGDYIPDLIVEDSVIVEIKAATGLDRVHRQQCINYLRATGYRLCLLLNFGQARLQVERLVWRF